jgi:nucleoside diphosphate-linked moiety X motif protein 19
MKVAPSFHVFPGGKIDDLLDQSADWFKLFLNTTNQHDNSADRHLITSTFSRLIGPNSLGKIIDNKGENNRVKLPLEISFRLCAIRETFEETGVLLAMQREKKFVAHDYQLAPKRLASVFENEIIHEWHDIVRKDPNQFVNMFFELNLLPDVFALHEWSNWITPPHEKARFNTIFFTCFLSQLPTRININRDEIETVEVSST